MLPNSLTAEILLKKGLWSRKHGEITLDVEIGRNWRDTSASHRNNVLPASTGRLGEGPGADSPQPPDVNSHT